jgi:hypothetical protein
LSQRPELGVTRRTSHVLVPCRSGAAPVVRRLLTRDLSGWSIDDGTADGLIIAAMEAVGNAAANSARAGDERMLIVSWSYASGVFRLSVEDRGSRVQALPVAATSGTSGGAGSHPAFTGRVQAPAGSGHPAAHPAAEGCERRAAAMRAHPSSGASRGRPVLEAFMDRVAIHQGMLGTRVVIEKAVG